MTIRICPTDTFFFRDGKPFSMGAETWADSVFPPAPSVFYGALRTCWLSQQEGNFNKDNIGKSEKLEITGIYIEINNNLYLPVPKDFVEKKRNSAERLLTDNIETVYSNKNLAVLNISDTKEIVEEISKNAIMSLEYFEQYLQKSNISRLPYRSASSYLIKESKIGIARNKSSRTTEEGLLYRVDLNRFMNDGFNNIAFVVEFHGLDNFPPSGKIKLGGEGKISTFETIPTVKINPPPFSNQKAFKIYFATPTIFENGWLPSWIDKETLLSKDIEFKIRLITATLDKPSSIGGFDLVLKQPKPMYKAIPSGAIYHFELLEGQMSDVIAKYHGKSNSEIYAKQGFGLSYIGIS